MINPYISSRFSLLWLLLAFGLRRNLTLSTLSDHPPVVVFDDVLGTLDDRIKVVFVWVSLTNHLLGLDESILKHFQQLNFNRSQVSMPKINDQNEPSFLTIVPCLMLKTIVKNISLSFLLLPSLIADPHSTAFDSNQRQMEPQLLVGGSIVRHDV